MPVGRADAIRAGITAADDHHMLAAGPELFDFAITRHPPVLQGKEIHREMHAIQLTARDRQIAWLLGATREHDGVELVGDSRRIEHGGRPVSGAHRRLADNMVGAELDAFCLHLLDTPVDQVFLHLEIRDAVAQQTADAVVLFKQNHRVTGARELLGGGKAGGA